MQTTRRSRRPLVVVLLALYVIAAALIAFWPTPVDAGLAPTLNAAITKLHANGLPTWLGYDQLEFVANIVFFIPLGLLLALLLGRSRWWVAILIALAASIAIELIQGELLTERFANVPDVVANVAGAAIGGLLAKSRRGGLT